MKRALTLDYVFEGRPAQGLISSAATRPGLCMQPATSPSTRSASGWRRKIEVIIRYAEPAARKRSFRFRPNLDHYGFAPAAAKSRDGSVSRQQPTVRRHRPRGGSAVSMTVCRRCSPGGGTSDHGAADAFARLCVAILQAEGTCGAAVGDVARTARAPARVPSIACRNSPQRGPLKRRFGFPQ